MKNVRIRVRENCRSDLWDYAIFDSKRRQCFGYMDWYNSKSEAIRRAKAMSKRIGIKYDSEIIKLHGC